MSFHNAYGLFFHGDEILIHREKAQFIISLQDIYSDEEFSEFHQNNYFIGKIFEKNVYAVGVSSQIIEKKKQFYFLPIKRLLETLEPELFRYVCLGKQLLGWNNNSRFCSACGVLNQPSQTEIAKICPACQRIHYPSYSPAIIILIERDNEILLGRSPHFAKDIYSPLAGFLEPAESAEEAAVREVREEVGLEIKNIRYFSSQSWPFPNSLMLGYTATYAGGEICVNHAELEDARWFTVDKLPLLPSKASISRHLIDAFIARKKV